MSILSTSSTRIRRNIADESSASDDDNNTRRELTDFEKVMRAGHKHVGTASDFDSAIGMLVHLLNQKNEPVIVVRLPDQCSRREHDRLNKWARQRYYVTRIEGGFVVYPSKRK